MLKHTSETGPIWSSGSISVFVKTPWKYLSWNVFHRDLLKTNYESALLLTIAYKILLDVANSYLVISIVAVTFWTTAKTYSQECDWQRNPSTWKVNGKIEFCLTGEIWGWDLWLEVITFYCKSITSICEQHLLTLAQVQSRPEREEKTVRMLEVISTTIMKINIVSKQKNNL